MQFLHDILINIQLKLSLDVCNLLRMIMSVDLALLEDEDHYLFQLVVVLEVGVVENVEISV